MHRFEALRRRGDLALRILAALPLGYAVATLWAMALSRILPMPRADATTTGMLTAFAICAVAAMWSFAAKSGWRAVWVLAVAGGVAAAITWAAMAGGAA
ncbi:hypothetical protein OK349_16025 [Sphingomonas sp. BT-65]|uniref:hypothetical protein n=1 Tax=Sphingomonas sp. BT-65 TaxID=2989821 RepID=UPI002235F520|nr:hypothetical protein [Sphingomonas sp. BT-65]MCW4463221.1 hypothetical protein [Sphingomonas sp. BT-65]